MTEGMPVPEPQAKEGFIARMGRKLKERYSVPAAMDKALRQIESIQGPLTDEQKMQVADQIGGRVRSKVVGAIMRDSIATALVATGIGAYRFNDRIRVNVNVKLGKAAEKFGKSVDKGLKSVQKGLEGKDTWFANHLRPMVDSAQKKVVDKKGAIRFGQWFHKDTAAALAGGLSGREKAAKAVIDAKLHLEKIKGKGDEQKAAKQVFDAARDAFKKSEAAQKSLEDIAQKGLGVEPPALKSKIETIFVNANKAMSNEKAKKIMKKLPTTGALKKK